MRTHAVFTAVNGEHDCITLIPRGVSRDLMLTQDGQLAYEVFPHDRIDINLAADKKIRTVNLTGRNFLDIVRDKLGWGSSRGVHD